MAARGNASLRAAYVYDGGRFPFPDGAYDCAVANYVIEHVRFPVHFTREVARGLKPGGRFYFRAPNLLHYVALPARPTPHRVHELLA